MPQQGEIWLWNDHGTARHCLMFSVATIQKVDDWYIVLRLDYLELDNGIIRTAFPIQWVPERWRKVA
jgi:hypothetical protein